MRSLILLGCLCFSGYCLEVKLPISSQVGNSNSFASRYTAKLLDDMRNPKIPQNFVPILNLPPAERSHDRIKLRKPKSHNFSIPQKNYEALKAAQHFLEMEEKASCSLPSPRVFCVQDHYPNADIAYKPACTILHRCSSESGCCKDPEQTCSVKTAERVTLYFEDSNKEWTTLKLSFENHTSCHCETTNEVEDFGFSDPSDQNDAKERPFHDDNDSSEDVLRSCPRCPQPFSKRFHRGICQCDCFEDDAACISIKEGQEALKAEERACVQRRVCNQPTCTPGNHYNENFGECRKPYYEEIVGATESQDDQPETTEVTKQKRVRHRRKKTSRTHSQ